MINKYFSALLQIAGAKGLKGSLYLTSLLTLSFINLSLESAIILLFPKALSPNSKEPWNQPIILPSTMFFAACSSTLTIF